MDDRDRGRLQEIADLDHIGGLDVPYMTRGHRKLVEQGWATAIPHREGGALLKITATGRRAIGAEEEA